MTESEIRQSIRQKRQQILDNWDNDAKCDLLTAELIALKSKLANEEYEKPVGQWSGLTRQELAKTGTCETDWY